MTFAGLPLGAIAGAFAAAGAAIVALHLVRVRRRRVEVPFAALYLRALGERARGLAGYRFRRLLSLLLALAALACLALAAGDPRPAMRARTIAFLVDASGSMQALDERGAGGAPVTRFERAQAEAKALVGSLGPLDRALVIQLDGRPRPLGGLTADGAELVAQLDAMRPGEDAADLDAGLRLAADVLRDRPDPSIVLIGDGAWPEAELDASPPSLDPAHIATYFLPVGTTGEDLAISAFAVRRYPSRAADCEVFVEIASRRPAVEEVELQIRADGALVDVERVTVPAMGRVRRVLADRPGRGSRFEARIVRPDGRALDVYPLDDRAEATLAPRRRARVLLVGEGNLFVEGALLAGQDVALEKVRPAAWDEATAAGFDVIVLDGFTPSRPPSAPALYLDPRGAGSPFAVRGALRDPVITETARHPITRFVSLADVNVGAASRFAVAPGDAVLASVLSAPIFVARDARPRVAALGFDVRRSDLPLRVGFPVLLANAIEWLAGGQGTDGVGQGARVDERIEPVRTLKLAGRAVPPPDALRRPAVREAWRGLLIAAIVLLLVEWWAFHRRVTA